MKLPLRLPEVLPPVPDLLRREVREDEDAYDPPPAAAREPPPPPPPPGDLPGVEEGEEAWRRGIINSTQEAASNSLRTH